MRSHNQSWWGLRNGGERVLRAGDLLRSDSKRNTLLRRSRPSLFDIRLSHGLARSGLLNVSSVSGADTVQLTKQ